MSHTLPPYQHGGAPAMSPAQQYPYGQSSAQQPQGISDADSTGSSADEEEVQLKCNKCFNNLLNENSEGEQTVQKFFEIAKKNVETKSMSGLPRFTGSNHREFVDAVHAFCLECQPLLPGWKPPFDDNTLLAPELLHVFEDVESKIGFVGDFAILFHHIVGRPADINHLLDGNGRLSPAAKRLCKTPYRNNVQLYFEQLEGKIERKEDPETERKRRKLVYDRNGLFTGETLLHIMIVNNRGAVKKLLKLAQQEFGTPKPEPGSSAPRGKSFDSRKRLDRDSPGWEAKWEFMHMVTHPADGLFFQPKVIFRPEWRSGFSGVLFKFISLFSLSGDPVGGITFNDRSSCYFGERPLAFAASVGNISALDALFEEVSKEAQNRFGDSKKKNAFVQAFLEDHDSFGNTALHMAVKYQNTEVIDWFVQKDGELGTNGSAFRRLNYDLQTPLTFAVFLGFLEIFRHIIAEMKYQNVLWEYGRCSHTITDLGQIDSWQSTIEVGRQKRKGFNDVWLFPITLEKDLDKVEKKFKGKDEKAKEEEEKVVWDKFRKKVKMSNGPKQGEMWKGWNTRPQSALQLAVRLEVQKASEEPIFISLIQNKWSDYARAFYLITAIIPYIGFLIGITFYISHRAGKFRSGLEAGLTEEDVAELGGARDTAGEVVFLLIYSVILFFRGWIHMRVDYTDLDTNNDRNISSREIESFLFKNMVSAMAFALVVLMWASWLCRITHNGWESNLLAILGMLSWVHGATYLIPFKFFGKLIIAIHRMIAIDLLQFLAVWIFTLFGFSIAMYSLIQGVPAEILEAESCLKCDEHWLRLALRYLWASLGEVDMTQTMMNARSPWLALGLHICFTIASTVLLLNLLIALLSKTFSDNEVTGAERWWHEFGGTVLRYEQWMRRIFTVMNWLHMKKWKAKAMAHVRTGQPDNGRCVEHDNYFPFHLNETDEKVEDPSSAAIKEVAAAALKEAAAAENKNSESAPAHQQPQHRHSSSSASFSAPMHNTQARSASPYNNVGWHGQQGAAPNGRTGIGANLMYGPSVGAYGGGYPNFHGYA